MKLAGAELRDQIVALLVSLDDAVRRPTLPAMSQVGKNILPGGWLRAALEDEGAESAMRGLPNWLTIDDDSALTRILGAATGNGAEPEETRRVITALGEAQLLELLDFYDRLMTSSAGRPAPPGGAPPLTAVMKVREHYVATSLHTAREPGPWNTRMDWASRCMASAVAAVRDLLRSFESIAYMTTDRAELFWAAWPAQNQAEDPAITLGLAIDILANVTGLGRPSATADVLLAGAWDGGRFLPMADAEIEARLAAVRHLTNRILVPTAQGWAVVGPDDDTVQRLTTATTLDDAAEAVWGEVWLAWKREQHRQELQRLGWLLVPRTGPPFAGGLPETSIPQVDALDILFRGQSRESRPGTEAGPEAGEKPKVDPDKGVHRRVAVLGGPAGSGKSVIVRRLAVRITAGRHPWSVLVIAPMSGELPDRHVAVQAGRHALGTLEHLDHRHCLLVLEDLLPLGEGNVGAVLAYLSEALRVSVLGVVQFDVNSGTEWTTDAVELIPAVVGKAEMQAFVKHMAWVHPGLVDREAGLAEIERGSGGARDIGRLVRAMRKLPGLNAEDAGEASDSHTSPSQILRQRFLALDGSSRGAIATLAAASLTRGHVEADLLAGLTEDDLAAFGVEQFWHDGQLKMSSPADSAQVLEFYFRSRQADDGSDGSGSSSPTPGQLQDLMAGLLLPLLEPALRGGLDSALTRLRGARLYHSRVCASLLRASWNNGTLRQWLAQTSAITLAGFLLGLTTSLDDDITAAAVRELVAKIHNDPTPMRLHDLVRMVRVLRECVSTDSLEFETFADWLYNQVSAVITRGEGSADERLNLLRRVVWFQNPELNGLVKERIVEIVDHLDPGQANDYYLVPQVQRLQIRAERNAAEEFSKWPVDQEDDVSRLLTYDQPQETGFHILVAQMLLRRYLQKTEWWPMLDEFEHRFPRAIKLSSPRDVTRCFQEVRHSNAMQRHSLLKRATVRHSNGEYLNALRGLVRESAPIEAAELLRSAYMLYDWAAYLLLYERDNTPHEGLAEALALQVKARNDVRAAGMLLSACQTVEDLYYYIADEAFTARFGQALGQEWVMDRLERDPRPSAKYYLVKGLWEAQVPFREECMQAVLEVTLRAITQSRRVWGPRLALQVGLDPDFGPRFLSSLRGRVSISELLRGMSPWSPPDAQVQFHRLGRALFPQAAHRYASQFDLRAFSERLGNASPVSAAECCYEVMRTLQAAGSSVDGSALLAAADQAAGCPGAWADRLDRVPTAEGFAQILNILRKVDPPGARQIVRDYSTRLARYRGSGDDAAETRLVRKVRHAMLDSAAAATSMLSALERTGGPGRQIYDQLIAKFFLMQIFTGDLQMTQSVPEQYMAASNLARIGIGPKSPWCQWMHPVYQLRRQKVRWIGSPRRLVEILRMMQLWDEEWAYDITRGIDYSKVAARLRRGLVADLPPAVDLASVLLTLNEHSGARQVVEFLSDAGWGTIVNRIGLRKAAALLRLVQEVQPQAVASVGGYINFCIADILDRVVVMDDYRMWMDVGHACHAMALAGLSVQIPSRPPARQPNLAYAPAVAWGLQRLPQARWRDQLLDTAMRRILAEPATSPGPLTCSLASASLAGCLDALLAVTPDLSPIFHGSVRGLADLYELAESHPKLAAALHPHQEELSTMLQGLHGAEAWDRRRLERSLARQNIGGSLGEAG